MTRCFKSNKEKKKNESNSNHRAWPCMPVHHNYTSFFSWPRRLAPDLEKKIMIPSIPSVMN